MEPLAVKWRELSEWYARDDAKEFVLYASLACWVLVQVLALGLLGWLGGATARDGPVGYLCFVLFFLAPELCATTYWLLVIALPQHVQVQMRRAYALQGQQLQELDVL